MRRTEHGIAHEIAADFHCPRLMASKLPNLRKYAQATLIRRPGAAHSTLPQGAALAIFSTRGRSSTLALPLVGVNFTMLSGPNLGLAGVTKGLEVWHASCNFSPANYIRDLLAARAARRTVSFPNNQFDHRLWIASFANSDCEGAEEGL